MKRWYDDPDFWARALRVICQIIVGLFIAMVVLMILFFCLPGCHNPEAPKQEEGCLCPPDYIEWDDSCSCDDPPPPPYEEGAEP